MALFVIFMNFLRWNLPKFLYHIASSGIRILNTKKVGFVKAVVSIFSNLCLLPLQKIWSYRFPWKTSSDWNKKFTTNLPNLMEFHQRKCKKIHCQFCLLCSCWCNKVSKNSDVFLQARADYLSFRPQRACDCKTIGSHLNALVGLLIHSLIQPVPCKNTCGTSTCLTAWKRGIALSVSCNPSSSLWATQWPFTRLGMSHFKGAQSRYFELFWPYTKLPSYGRKPEINSLIR